MLGNNDPMWSVPSPKSKITSAVWGPLDEVIITGHENGDICQWDVSVCLSVYLLLCFQVDLCYGIVSAQIVLLLLSNG